MSWPKLSVFLEGPRHPECCQSCGTAEGPLRRWREHDNEDRPTPVVVVLCKRCEDRLIEKHPRLFSPLDAHEPHAGSMALCVDCIHRDGVRCTLAQHNGGPGVLITTPKPTMIHVCRRGKGQRSGWMTWYPGPPKACDRREVANMIPTQEEARS